MLVVKAKRDEWECIYVQEPSPRISEAISPSRGRKRDASPEKEVQIKKVRTVAVQGPVTYKSRSNIQHEADGRYTPLGAQDWGAWYY